MFHLEQTFETYAFPTDLDSPKPEAWYPSRA
jgi:hypothetical protein